MEMVHSYLTTVVSIDREVQEKPVLVAETREEAFSAFFGQVMLELKNAETATMLLYEDYSIIAEVHLKEREIDGEDI